MVTPIEHTTGRVQHLSTNLLHPNPWNPNRMTESEFAELLEEVRHLERLPKPVIVRAVAESYEIVDGEHGWRAAKELGLQEIPCEVVAVDDFEAMRQTYKRNQHGTHDRAALGQMFRRMRDERGMSNRGLAKEISVSEGTVRTAMTFAEAAELRKRYAGRPTPDHRFEKMSVRQARVYVILPDSVRDRWLDSGASIEDLAPEGWVFECEADIAGYYRQVEEAGLASIFERGSFAASVEQAAKIWEWWSRHKRYIDKLDAYIPPVIALHSQRPTPIELLERLPLHDGKPLLSPKEWAGAVRAAWDKTIDGRGSALAVLERLSDAAKLKAGETGISTEDLEDPRVALRKFEIETEAPGFIRSAALSLKEKHFLMRAEADGLSEADTLTLKREAVRLLIERHEGYQKERAEYEQFLKNASLADLTATINGGGGLRYPWPPRVQAVWDACIKGWRRHQQRSAEATEREKQRALWDSTFSEREQLIEAIVSKLRQQVPKTMDTPVGDKAAWQVLKERLMSVPEPELLMMGAVLLNAPVSYWLTAVRQGEEDEV